MILYDLSRDFAEAASVPWRSASWQVDSQRKSDGAVEKKAASEANGR
jgi:hypothetical protein